jgi:deferrochelatase/peroxidase EfeB
MAALQEGIYFEKDVTPGRCFAILFLRARQEASAPAIGQLMLKIWQTQQELKRGKVADLPGVETPPGNLSVLVGYGPKAFALPGPNARRILPRVLNPANQFRSSSPGGGNAILSGAELRYVEGLQKNLATEEIALQFIGDTPLAVNRAVVESWKVLQDNCDASTHEADLSISGVFTGFNREDHRSWIDFHDGLSNLESGNPRRRVIEIRSQSAAGDDWTIGGTTMVFMRLAVDLQRWRALSRSEQELLVGRDKITGCALQRIDASGAPVPLAGCPLAGSRDVLNPGQENFREPPSNVEAPLKKSHVQRANQIKDVGNPASLRVFRQGYEFLEGAASGGKLLLGLNFISFQDTPSRIINILTRQTWLQGVNFGGDPSQPRPGSPELLTVHAAGCYLVPPVTETEQFPGQSIFTGTDDAS